MFSSNTKQQLLRQLPLFSYGDMSHVIRAAGKESRMLVLNRFMLILDCQLSKYPDPDRHRIRDAIIRDLIQTTNIFDSLEDMDDDDYDYDDWVSEQQEMSPAVCTKEARVLEKQRELKIDIVAETVAPKRRWGRSDLHEAVAMSDLDTVHRLLSEGQDVNVRDNNGNTPLDFAMLEANQEVIAVFRAAGYL